MIVANIFTGIAIVIIIAALAYTVFAIGMMPYPDLTVNRNKDRNKQNV